MLKKRRHGATGRGHAAILRVGELTLSERLVLLAGAWPPDDPRPAIGERRCRWRDWRDAAAAYELVRDELLAQQRGRKPYAEYLREGMSPEEAIAAFEAADDAERTRQWGPLA